MLVAVSALTLTACQGGGGTKDGASGGGKATASPSKAADSGSSGAASAGSPAGSSGSGSTGGASGSSGAGGSGAGKGKGKGSSASGGSSSGSKGSSGGSAGTGGGGASGGVSPIGDAAVHPCSTAEVTFTATVADATTSSYLLKVTNKSSKPCNALDYPIVTFGDLDGQAIQREETHPHVVLTLKPGESAYAGLMGGAKDGKGKTVDSIAMTMDTGTALDQKPLTAATPGLYVSAKASVTAWWNNAEDALSL